MEDECVVSLYYELSDSERAIHPLLKIRVHIRALVNLGNRRQSNCIGRHNTINGNRSTIHHITQEFTQHTKAVEIASRL